MLSQSTFQFADPALSRRTDPSTSHVAAAKVDTSKLEAIVLDALRQSPQGLTSHQIASQLRLSLVTVSPRMRPLVRKGLITDTARTIEQGRQRILWQAVRS